MFRHHKYKVRYIVATESNTGLEASVVSDILKYHRNVVILRETGKDHRTGCWTSDVRKNHFVRVLETMLNASSIMFATEMVSDDIKNCLQTLKTQLGSYRMVENSRSLVSGLAKYTGKVAADGKVVPGMMQDDLCIALQIMAFYTTFCQNGQSCLPITHMTTPFGLNTPY